MFSHLSHTWPLIPINLALHFFRLVDTPADADFPPFHDGPYTADDHADDVVVDYESTREVVALLLCLLMMLRPFLWLFFLRCLRFPIGFWRLATSWPCPDNVGHRATLPPSAFNTIAQGTGETRRRFSSQSSGLPQGESVTAMIRLPKTPVEMERDAALKQVEDLKKQLQEERERSAKWLGEGMMWCIGFHDLLSGANLLVERYNQLAGWLEFFRVRSANQTELARLLRPVLRLDRDQWLQLSESERNDLIADVVENFVDDPDSEDRVERAQFWPDMRQQQEPDGEDEQPDFDDDDAAGPSGFVYDPQSEMEGDDEEDQRSEHGSTESDGHHFFNDDNLFRDSDDDIGFAGSDD